MNEERHHIEPGCIGTFSTPNPSPETLGILKDVIRMAREREDVRGRATGRKGERSEAPATKEQSGTPEARDGEERAGAPKEERPTNPTK